jgi:hypothetical protein
MVGVLRAFGSLVRRCFPGFILLPRRCMSPLAVHDNAQCYANPSICAMVRMSALGHKRTYAVQKGMSALPPIADIRDAKTNVCFVPKADIAHHSINSSARVSSEGEMANPNAFAVWRSSADGPLLCPFSLLTGNFTGNFAKSCLWEPQRQ